MLKKLIMIFWILIFFPAFSLEASPATIKKVFEYIDAHYVDPINPSLIYIKTKHSQKLRIL